jgi:protein-disulfide isomerase
VRKSNGKVRVVYKHFVVHPEAVMTAHLAACAAHRQGKFKEFTYAFWKDGYGAFQASRDESKLGRENVLAIAGAVGLDVAKLTADIDGPECQQRIQADMAELGRLHVGGTPSFFVNGKFTMFAGPGPFQQVVDAALAEVERSGVPADQYYQKVVLGQGEKQFISIKDARARKGKAGGK